MLAPPSHPPTKKGFIGPSFQMQKLSFEVRKLSTGNEGAGDGEVRGQWEPLTSLGRAGKSGKVSAANADLLLPSWVCRQHSGGGEELSDMDYHSVKSGCFNFLQPDFGRCAKGGPDCYLCPVRLDLCESECPHCSPLPCSLRVPEPGRLCHHLSLHPDAIQLPAKQCLVLPCGNENNLKGNFHLSFLHGI